MQPVEPDYRPVRRPPRPTRRARRRRRLALGAAVVVVLAAIGAAGAVVLGGGDEVRADRGTGGGTADATGAGDGGGDDAGPADTTTTTERGPLGSGNPVTLAFAGDSNFEGLGATLVSNPASVLAPVAPLLSAADVAVVNLETVLGDEQGTPAPKQFVFRVPAQALDAMSSAGVDVVTMANNHGMDYGLDGLEGSLAIRDATGFPVIGVGRDEVEAYKPYVTEVRGQRIGVLAANDVFDDNLRAEWTAGPGKPGIASAEEAHQERLAEEVRRLRPQVDTLAVYLHYGTEREVCPNQRQKDLVRLLLDAGADIVVGAHTHRLQGVGYLGDRFVAYGLGNFAFTANSAAGAQSGVLTVTATGRRVDSYQWAPATIRGARPFPDADPAPGLAVMAERQACAGLTPTPTAPLPADPAAAGPTTTPTG